MFKRDPTKSYMMPAHFGARYHGPGSSGWYRDVTALTVPYVTDGSQLAQLLPQGFEPAAEPVISVFYACNRQVDWLAGRGYNMIGVNADVTYRSDGESLEGTFALVIWENLADPILTGRELQGIPKVYADIPDHSISNDVCRCNASHFGHTIIDIEVSGLRAPELEEIAASVEARKGKDNPMGWRYIQQAGSFEAKLDEFTTFPSENHITQIMLGEGKVDWKELSWEQNPTQFHIVNALKSLPILDYRPAALTKGSTNLILPDRLTRPLK